MASGRFLTASRARIVYCLDHVVYYQPEDNGKVKVHFSNGESKDLEAEDARVFLTEVNRVSVSPTSPAQAA